MKPFTLQEVFDRALKGMRAQDYVKSISGLGCAYLADNGLKCHIGHCIDDPELARRMDANGDTIIPSVLESMSEVRWLFQNIDPEVLQDLQVIHDTVSIPCDVSMYEASMRRYAERHGLTYTTPETTT